MQKNFTAWHQLKAQLNDQGEPPTFQQREIWWCSIGVNIGHEMDGKNQLFHRPVLVVRKFNQYIFLGVPLTTQIKANPYYHHFSFKGREQCAMLSQLRLWESRRLTDKLGKLPPEQFQLVRQALKGML